MDKVSVDKVKLATIAAFVLSIGLAGSAIFAGGRVADVLYSPGRIDRQHRDATCTDCHTPFRGVNSAGCESGDCHSPAEFAGAGPAVAVAHEGPGADDCLACHTEHRGTDGPITLAYHRVVPDGFRGSVEGDCESCHGEEGRAAHPDIRSESCASCHTSTSDWRQVTFRHPWIPEYREHLGEVGCADCHPRSLTESVTCASCHGGGRGRYEGDDDD